MLNRPENKADEDTSPPLVTWLVSGLFLAAFALIIALYVWNVGDFWALLS